MDPFLSDLIMILCFIVGSGLIIVEAFIPGFGVAGTVGLLLEITAIVFTGRNYGTGWALGATFGVLLLISLAVFLSYRSALHGRPSKSSLILKDTEDAANAPANAVSWDGKQGIAATALRPAGFIEIEGSRLNASTAGEFVKKGTPVVVTGAEGDHLLVRQA